MGNLLMRFVANLVSVSLFPEIRQGKTPKGQLASGRFVTRKLNPLVAGHGYYTSLLYRIATEIASLIIPARAGNWCP